ncbi:MAG: hypothetical protein H7175_24560, partial [Burkholderiales bacterium]|nr:hypothetical protein [Anaerolineae bacterium]
VAPSKEDLDLIREVFNLNGLAEDQAPTVEDADESVNGATRSTNGSNGFTPDDDDDLEDDDDFDPDEDFEPGDVPPIIRYMHLKDVYILLPVPHDGFTQSFVPIWRIKHTSIDGWLLGQAVPNVPPGAGATKTDD